MNAHTYQKRPDQITVAELVARIAAEGSPIRLAWPEDQINAQVNRDQDEWPTGIISQDVIEKAIQDARRAG